MILSITDFFLLSITDFCCSLPVIVFISIKMYPMSTVSVYHGAPTLVGELLYVQMILKTTNAEFQNSYTSKI